MLELQQWLCPASPPLFPPPSALRFRHRFLLYGDAGADDGLALGFHADENSPGAAFYLSTSPTPASLSPSFLAPADIDLATAAEIDEWILDPDSEFDSVGASSASARTPAAAAELAMGASVAAEEDRNGNKPADREKDECESIDAVDGYCHSKIVSGFAEGCLESRKALAEALKDAIMAAEEMDRSRKTDMEKGECESADAADGYGHIMLDLGFAEGFLDLRKTPLEASKDRNKQVDREKDEHKRITVDGHGRRKLILGSAEGFFDLRKIPTEVLKEGVVEEEKDRNKQMEMEKDEHESVTTYDHGHHKLVSGIAEGFLDPQRTPMEVSKEAMVAKEKGGNERTDREKEKCKSEQSGHGCNNLILGIAEGFLDPQKTSIEFLKEAMVAEEKGGNEQTDREKEKRKSKQRDEREREMQGGMGDADEYKGHNRNRDIKTETDDGKGSRLDKIKEPTRKFQRRDQRARREGIMKEADESKGIINRNIGGKMETNNGRVKIEENGYCFRKDMVGEDYGVQEMEVDKVEIKDMGCRERGLARIKETLMEEEQKGIVLDAEKGKPSILQCDNGIALLEDGHHSSSSSPLSAMEVEMHMVVSTVSCGNHLLEADGKAIDFISSRLEGQKISNKCRILSKGDSDVESGEIRFEHENAGEETEGDETEISSADDSSETSSSIDSEVESKVRKKQISHRLRRVVTTKKCRPSNEVDSDIDSEDEGNKCPTLSQNELQDANIGMQHFHLGGITGLQLLPVPPVGARLEPHHMPLPVGVIFSILESNLVVEVTEAQPPLNQGSILWLTELRSPLGYIDEIFGPVKKPFYVVRYNNPSDIPAAAKVGVSVAFVPDFATFVLNDPNLYKKGYDASGENDEEFSGSEAEFSDDAKEAEYKSSKARNKRGYCEKEREEDELCDHSLLKRGNRKLQTGDFDRRDLRQVHSVPLHLYKQDPHLEEVSYSEASFKGRCALLEPNRYPSPLLQQPLQQFRHGGESKDSSPNQKSIQVQPPLPPLPPQYDPNKEKFAKVSLLQEPPSTRKHGQYRSRWEDRDPVDEPSSQQQNGINNTGQRAELQLGEHQHWQLGNEEKKPLQTARYGGISANALHPFHIQRTLPHPPSPAPQKHEAYNEQLPQYNKQYRHEDYENPCQASSLRNEFRHTRLINDGTTSASPLHQHGHSCGGNEELQKPFRLPSQPRRCGGASATSRSPRQCRSGGSMSLNNSSQPPFPLPQARLQLELHLPSLPPRYNHHHHSNHQNPLPLDLSSNEPLPQHHHECKHMGLRNDGSSSAPSPQQHEYRHGSNKEWNHNSSMEYPPPYRHSSSQSPFPNALHPPENGGFGASLNNHPRCSTHPPLNNPPHCSSHPATLNNPPHCSSHPATLNNPPYCSTHPPTLNNPPHCSTHPPTLNNPPHCSTHPPIQGSWQGGYHNHAAHFYPHLPTPQIGTGFVVQGFPVPFASQNPQAYYTAQPPMDPGTVLGVPAGPVNSYPSSFNHEQTPYHHQTMGQFVNPYPPQQLAPNAISPYQGQFIPHM